MAVVSIIMPVYNAEAYIRDSIEDICNQTFSEFELICVDDGSSDDSLTIIQEYSQKDARIKYILQDHLGGGIARNTGMQAATGKYLLFLDADDRFDKKLLETTVVKAENCDAEIVIFGADSFDALTGKIGNLDRHLRMDWVTFSDINPEIVSESCLRDNLYKFTSTTVWNKLYKKEFILKSDLKFQDILVVDTLYFVMCAMAVAKRVTIVNEKMVHYRRNTPNGQISNPDKSVTGIYEAAKNVIAYYKKNSIQDKLKKPFIEYFFDNVQIRLKMFKTAKAEKELYEILHNSGLKKLEICESDINLISNEQTKNFAEMLYELSYEEYLFKKYKDLKENHIIPQEKFILPNYDIPAQTKVVLYGAGDVGNAFYTQIQNSKRWKLVAWMDRDYRNCGYPVQNPEMLKQLEYEAIIIAVEDETLAKKIKCSLSEMGVNESKLHWQKTSKVI